MPKICFLQYVLEGTFFGTNALICYWNNRRISKNEIYSYDFFLIAQSMLNLILIFKKL